MHLHRGSGRASARGGRSAENRREVERFAARLDVLIAGHARSRDLVVVTGNLGEFSHVDGLRYEDWLAEGGGT